MASKDGIMTCKGFSTLHDNILSGKFVSLGKFSGKAGSIVKIEITCALSAPQGTVTSTTITGTINTGTRGGTPALVNIYCIFNNGVNNEGGGSSADRNNLEGYYTETGNKVVDSVVVLRHTDNFIYSVLIKVPHDNNSIQYQVYMSNSSNWVLESQQPAPTKSSTLKTYDNDTAFGGLKYFYLPLLYSVNLAGLITSPSGFNVSSSLRYKKNIENLPDMYNLDMLMKYNPITYESINDNCRHIGLIAEELDECGAKYFINYNSENQPDSVDYARINVHLIKCIQELNIKIDKMQQQIDSQSNPV